jgi:hypothetical protein
MVTELQADVAQSTHGVEKLAENSRSESRPLPKTGAGSDEMGISKTTLSEHLGKAEAKLLSQYSQ